MRRLLSISFIILALAVGAAPAAHAQDTPTEDHNTVIAPATGSSVTSQQTTANQTAANGTPTNPNFSGDASSQFGSVMTWIMSLFAWLVGVAAITLDNVVYYTVVTMGNYIHNLPAVGATWQILRDISNILLIFGFLAIGISTILDESLYGWSKNLLPMLLVAAVFLNFSLFISEAVIDVGNLFATQFYTEINHGNPAQPTGYSINLGVTSLGNNQVANEPISNAIMGNLGLQTVYNANTNPAALQGGHTWFIGFMSIILFLIAAFVMFALAFILVARFIVLLFLIILAPAGFAGLAVPKLSNLAGRWWSELFSQTITAPILLLLLYIALRIITTTQFITGFQANTSQGWFGLVDETNITGFASMLLSFIVAMGLLLSVVIFAKKLSAFGADWATKTAGKLTFGATAWAGRATVGWGSQGLSQAWRRTSLSRVPIAGRAVSGLLDRGAKASFDIRGAAIGGGLKGIGVEAGAAQKGGYRAVLDEAIKGREGYAKTLQRTRGEKKAEEEGKSEQKEAEERLKKAKAADNMYSTTDTKAELAEAQKALADAQTKIRENRQAPQVGYAKGLETVPWGILTRNSKAAENIRKTAGKSKEEKDVDTLMELLKKNSEKSEGASAPTPPAGGGAPKP